MHLHCPPRGKPLLLPPANWKNSAFNSRPFLPFLYPTTCGHIIRTNPWGERQQEKKDSQKTISAGQLACPATGLKPNCLTDGGQAESHRNKAARSRICPPPKGVQRIWLGASAVAQIGGFEFSGETRAANSARRDALLMRSVIRRQCQVQTSSRLISH
jgi:hypothetical protein